MRESSCFWRRSLFCKPRHKLEKSMRHFCRGRCQPRGANRIIENSKKKNIICKVINRAPIVSNETFSIWVITTHNLPACAAPGLWLMAPLYTPNNNYRCMARLKFIHFICILLSHKLYDSASLYSVTTTIWKYSPTFTWAINLRSVQLHACIRISMERCVSYINMRELHALVCESACPTRPCLCVSLSFSLYIQQPTIL